MSNSYAWRVRLRCRNSKCPAQWSRRTARKRPEEYKTEKARIKNCACTTCGRIMTVDKYRQSKRERRKVRCNCGARTWKHTRGRYCREHAERIKAAESPQDSFTTFSDFPTWGSM